MIWVVFICGRSTKLRKSYYFRSDIFYRFSNQVKEFTIFHSVLPVYNMGPRSWKPETSLKDQVGDSEAAKMVEEISEKLRTFLDPEDEEQLQEMETISANEEAVGIDLTFTNR